MRECRLGQKSREGLGFRHLVDGLCCSEGHSRVGAPRSLGIGGGGGDVHAYMHTHICACVHVYIHVFVYVCLHKQAPALSLCWTSDLCACVYVYVSELLLCVCV